MTAYHLERLRESQGVIDRSYGYWGTSGLMDGIHMALGAPQISALHGLVSHTGERLRAQTVALDTAATKVHELAARKLPEAIVAQTGVRAAEAMTALESAIERSVGLLAKVSDALVAMGRELEDLARKDRSGVEQLEEARRRLDQIDNFLGIGYDGAEMVAVHHIAMAAADSRVAAHNRAMELAEQATRLLNDVAGQARLARLGGSPLRALDELVIANAGTAMYGAVLTANSADRAAQRLNAMSEADRARLLALLAQAVSPLEKAYLLKAVAAGSDIGAIEEFSRLIHPYGANAAWLNAHLSPLDNHTANPYAGVKSTTQLDGTRWTQGQNPTCVAFSTMVARADVDPLYALQLTTGGHPGDPAFDNSDAFRQRLDQEQFRIYDGGRNGFQQLFGIPGMAEWQSEAVADQEIGLRNGVDYDSRFLDSDSARRDSLTDIARAVDEGVPVPLSVGDGPFVTHQMMIVGHENGLLQIYNPWGYTIWVTEDDFVHGRLDQVIDPDVPAAPLNIKLPRG